MCMCDGKALVLVTMAVQVLVQTLKPEMLPKQFEHKLLRLSAGLNPKPAE